LPFAPGEVLGTTLLPIPAASSAEVLVPLPLSLQPGNYLLVFGSGMYGATGEGSLTTINPALAPPIFTTYSDNPFNKGWADAELTEMGNPNLTLRLVIEAIPEPSSAALLTLGSLIFGLWTKSYRNKLHY
jgi:hypothetical protein